MNIMKLFGMGNRKATDPKAHELYETLNNETYKTRPWQTEDLDEGMAIVNQVIGEYWKPRFLIDHTALCAYEFMSRNETLCNVKQEDIDWDSLKSLSQECIARARSLDYHYPSFVRKYENGVAQVSWQLNPDGMYFMDEDGFGMTDDDEVTIYGFIDRKGNVLVRFRYIGENWKLLDAMRKEAEKLVKP